MKHRLFILSDKYISSRSNGNISDYFRMRTELSVNHSKQHKLFIQVTVHERSNLFHESYITRDYMIL